MDEHFFEKQFRVWLELLSLQIITLRLLGRYDNNVKTEAVCKIKELAGSALVELLEKAKSDCILSVERRSEQVLGYSAQAISIAKSLDKMDDSDEIGEKLSANLQGHHLALLDALNSNEQSMTESIESFFSKIIKDLSDLVASLDKI